MPLKSVNPYKAGDEVTVLCSAYPYETGLVKMPEGMASAVDAVVLKAKGDSVRIKFKVDGVTYEATVPYFACLLTGEKIMNKEYLGDGVYVQQGPDSNSITLTTENGVSVSNTIVLSAYEINGLIRYVKRVVPDLLEDDNA